MSNYDYDYDYQLLEDWEHNTENFLMFAELVCGISKSSKTYTDLQNEVTSVEEIEKWIYYFNGDLDSIEATTEMFMESKRSAA